MDGNELRADLLIAGAAAGATVALTLVFEFVLGADAVLPRLSPLAVYFVYLFGKRTPLSTIGARSWIAATVVVAGATVGLYALG